jgi:septal ring-binding cell division protein DamX
MNAEADQWLDQTNRHPTWYRRMIRGLAAHPIRTIGWTAAAILVILLAAVWLYSDRKVQAPQPVAKKISPETFRAKIPAAPESETPPTLIATAPQEVEDTQIPTEEPIQPLPEASSPPPITEFKESELPESEGPLEEEQPHAPAEAQPLPGTPAPQEIAEPESVDVGKLEIPAVPAEPVQAKETPKSSEIQREEWLLTHNSSFYTIQILGVRNEQTLLDFVKKHKLQEQPGEIAYYQTTYRGEIWYPLLYGVYATKAEALAGIKELPPSIQQSIPWVRKLSAVQAAIRKP